MTYQEFLVIVALLIANILYFLYLNGKEKRKQEVSQQRFEEKVNAVSRIVCPACRGENEEHERRSNKTYGSDGKIYWLHFSHQYEIPYNNTVLPCEGTEIRRILIWEHLGESE